MEGDTPHIVKEVNYATPCFNSFGHFVKDIKLGLGYLRTSIVIHVKREVNLAAHGLAHETTTHVVDIT